MFQGYVPDEREKDSFLASQPVQYFSCAPGSGKGKRAMLWQYQLALDPLAFSEVQTGPDCTSHGDRNARDSARAAGILSGRSAEEWFARGATEPTYGARGGGEGMSPARAARFVRDVGFLARKKYDAVDLSKYNFSIGNRWGNGSGPPAAVKALCSEHKVGTITQIKTMEDLCDALYNGYGVHSGQTAAWSQNPKGNYHPRVSKGWGHDMHIGGYDYTRQFWPFDVIFLMQSWGAWNVQPDDWPSDYPAPVPGMIISRADDAAICVDNGDCWAYSDVQGYPQTTLPDLGTIGMLKR